MKGVDSQSTRCEKGGENAIEPRQARTKERLWKTGDHSPEMVERKGGEGALEGKKKK